MMNTFGTRCPACLTAFKVHSDLLLLKNGYGTCGHCGHYFDMQVALFMLPPHTIQFIEQTNQTAQAHPVLSAVVLVHNEPFAAEPAAPEESGPKSIDQLSSENLAENISFHIYQPKPQTPEPILDGLSEAAHAAAPEAKAKVSQRGWLFYLNIVLLLLLLAQTVGIYSREISQQIPQTKGLFEQLNLPTDSQ